MTDDAPKFQDVNKLDKRIPPSLLMKYQGQWYILRAGLEWKASHLYGGGNYGVTTEVIEHGKDYCLAKATFKTKDGIEFSNYGEASLENVSNPVMRKYMLHLAVTRAECRALRMATACGYTSVDEMDMRGSATKEIPTSKTDSEKPTPAQLATLQAQKVEKTPENQREAKELIAAKVGEK